MWILGTRLALTFKKLTNNPKRNAMEATKGEIKQKMRYFLF